MSQFVVLPGSNLPLDRFNAHTMFLVTNMVRWKVYIRWSHTVAHLDNASAQAGPSSGIDVLCLDVEKGAGADIVCGNPPTFNLAGS